MTYTTTQIREFCDAFDRGELEYCALNTGSAIQMKWTPIAAINEMLYVMSKEYIALRITPKPVPPVYEPWTDIKEVPLEDWYNHVLSSANRWKISGIDMFEKRVCLCGIWRTLDELKDNFLHSPDPFAPDSEWMVCGRVKG